jgi:hypothetical protein
MADDVESWKTTGGRRRNNGQKKHVMGREFFTSRLVLEMMNLK